MSDTKSEFKTGDKSTCSVCSREIQFVEAGVFGPLWRHTGVQPRHPAKPQVLAPETTRPQSVLDDEIIAELLRIKAGAPDLRFCQIISNAVYSLTKGQDIFNVSDAELLEHLRRTC